MQCYSSAMILVDLVAWVTLGALSSQAFPLHRDSMNGTAYGHGHKEQDSSLVLFSSLGQADHAFGPMHHAQQPSLYQDQPPMYQAPPPQHPAQHFMHNAELALHHAQQSQHPAQPSQHHAQPSEHQAQPQPSEHHDQRSLHPAQPSLPQPQPSEQHHVELSLHPGQPSVPHLHPGHVFGYFRSYMKWIMHHMPFGDKIYNFASTYWDSAKKLYLSLFAGVTDWYGKVVHSFNQPRSY